MSIDLNALKKVALAATPGPWEWYGSGAMLTALVDGDRQQVLWAANAMTADESHLGDEYKSPDGHVRASLRLGACGDRTEADADANHAFMAAANPSAVLELIARIDALEAELNTPVFTGVDTSHRDPPILGIDGLSHDLVDFVSAAAIPYLPEVHYGRRRIFASVAEFYSVHPRTKDEK